MHASTHAQIYAQVNARAHAYRHWRDLGWPTLASSLGSSALAGDEEKRLGREVNQPGLAVANLDSSDLTLPWMMSRALLAMLNALHK